MLSKIHLTNTLYTVLLAMDIAIINGETVEASVIDRALSGMPVELDKKDETGVKHSVVAPRRDKMGKLMKGGPSLNPLGRPKTKNKLQILSEDVRRLVIDEVTRILAEGESNQHYQPVLLKLMDKAMPSLKAIEVRGEQISQLGVIVLPAKKPIDIDDVRVDNPHLSEEYE